MALLNFPDNPLDGQLFPNPCPKGVTQYKWESSTGVWRIVGVATGVLPGRYGNEVTVAGYEVDVKGSITEAYNIPIREATTEETGIVQLNDTTTSSSITEALTARAGKYLQSQIGNLNDCIVPDHFNVVAALNDLQRQSNQLQAGALIWCGYYNAEEGYISRTSIVGAQLGYTDGTPLPVASTSNGGDFFIVEKAGNPYIAGDNNAPNAFVEQGNWIESETVRWTEVVTIGTIRASDVVFTPTGPLSATNVQNALYQVTQLFRTGIGGASISPTKPSNPYPGQLWWDSDDGLFYVYYSDINGNQWVEAGGGGSQGVSSSGSGTVYEVRTGVGLSGGPIITEGTIDLQPAYVSELNPSTNELGGVIPLRGFDYSNTTGELSLNITSDYTGKDPDAAFSQEGANLLNAKIDNVSGVNILAGTYDASRGVCVYVTPAGKAVGFEVNENVPTATPRVDNYYVIVTIGGSIGPTGAGNPSGPGDWWICQADTLPAVWLLIDYEIPGAVAANVALEPIPGIDQAVNVQRGMELLELQVQDRIEFVESLSDGMQIRVSQPGAYAYDGTTLSIGVDYASVADRGIVQLTNDYRGSSDQLALTQLAASELNSKIEALTGGSVLAGTYNANQGVMVNATPAGRNAGFQPGSQAPEADQVPDNYYVIVTIGGGYGPPGAILPAGGVQPGDWFINENTGGEAEWVCIDYDNRTVDASQVAIDTIPDISSTDVQGAMREMQAEILETITQLSSSNDGLTVEVKLVNGNFGYQGVFTLNPATTTDIGGVFVAPNFGLALTQSGGLSVTPATETTIGGVIIGDNLVVEPDGRISAQASGPTIYPAVQTLKDISPFFDGTTVTFDVEFASGDPFPDYLTADYLLIELGGILQTPVSAYLFDRTTSRLTFTSAPARGTTFSARAFTYREVQP
jgi:hypothetical protein